MKNVFVLMALVFSCSHPGDAIKESVLWYDQPAREWTEALPVGNGRIGAMVFGRVDTERIQLNEESLWAGSKIDNNNPQALRYLPKIRRLLFAGRFKKAVELSEKYLLGTPPRIRSYQPAGDLWLKFQFSGEPKNYRRELNLNTGICTIRYDLGTNRITRQVFASATDDVIVVRLESRERGGLDLAVGLTRERDARVRAASDHVLRLDGQIVDEPDPLCGPGGAHMKFAVRVLIKNEGGSVAARDSLLEVKDADALTLVLTAATDYNLYKLDFDRDIDPALKCENILQRVADKSFARLKSDHVSDHGALFERVQLDLGESENSHLPTDERLRLVKQGGEDPGLIALYFQYGRYLLMGSSRRPGVLPANLQGIWNEHLNAPWNSDFHTNINLQMNYWPAEVCNLPETVEPLTDFLLRLVEPGGVTARKTYGADGWTLHHLTDPFGRTGVADGVWGISPLAGPWMTFPIWRHFEFTQDTSYLRQKAYPLMRGAAEFVLDFLVEGPDGYLATAPSHSPENRFIVPGTGERSFLTYSATIDLQIIRGLFENCMAAAKILRTDEAFRQRLVETLERIPPIRIGRDGTIQEWIEDYEEADPGHRHMSHLLGLYPLAQITPQTPELFRAAKKTIERRLSHGGGHTGWSRAWIINFFARLHDGEKAYENLLALLRKSTLPNLFDTHPPFQIDGNFGGTAGIAEMLLQSHGGTLQLLPALPQAWPEGSVRGLKARGNFEVDMIWQDGQLRRVDIFSGSGLPCRVAYREKEISFETEKGTSYSLNGELLPL